MVEELFGWLESLKSSKPEKPVMVMNEMGNLSTPHTIWVEEGSTVSFLYGSPTDADRLVSCQVTFVRQELPALIEVLSEAGVTVPAATESLKLYSFEFAQ